jgi:hypothetical protein
MRYYFAGAYARRAELDKCAGWLLTEVPAARVVSRWLTDPQEGLDAGFSAGGLETPEAVSKAWEYGQRDLNDLASADVIVSFTGEGARGGRHIEHGAAIAYRDVWSPLTKMPPIRLIVVGPREHVFHCHPATEVYPYWAAFLAHEIEQYREENR